MKTIQPVTSWFNGSEVQAIVLNAYCQNDNLQDSASFQYQLLTEAGSPPNHPYLSPVVQGFLTMTGSVYNDWQTNDYAYDWIAQQLNLTITGEYVPPTPPQPEA